MSDIAKLIADLVKAGVSAELVGRVAAAIAHREPVLVPDERAEKRRAWDRDYRQKRRASTRFPPDSSGQDGSECPPDFHPISTRHSDRLARGKDNLLPRDSLESQVVDELTLSESNPTVVGAVFELEPDSGALKKTKLNGAARRKIGSRMTPDWRLSSADEDFARTLGFTTAQIAKIADSFRDFWLAKAGVDAIKVDWPATWRNWLRREQEKHPPPAEAKRVTWQ